MKHEEKHTHISLEHGSGGALSKELIEKVIYPFFQGRDFPELSDSSCFSLQGRAFITTDTYVVDPPFFPGGNIGSLAVFGTCNDLAVCGAEPRYLTLAFVIEEGFSIGELKKVLHSIKKAAEDAHVKILSGDTKVVPSGKGGGIYINTAGVGESIISFNLSPSRIREGDTILVSAPLGAHGITVLAARESLKIASSLSSDCASLYPLCRSLCSLGEELRFMRDATRGGAAAILNEIAESRSFGLEVVESNFPIEKKIAAAADILGLNVLEIANEGVLIAVVSENAGSKALELLHSKPLGQKACIVGRATSAYPGMVILETTVGGRRVLDLPRGLLLPRIC